MANMTEMQAKVKKFIAGFRAKHGFSPTIRELSEHFRMNVFGIQRHLLALEKKGHIHRTANTARSIVVVERR